ncbi:MAG: MarC family protein [Verrucomicrobiae bacterium]|nr:MarC family protein [Verrucomicrobiae bacterium]
MILENAIYFLALINPVSKVFVLSSANPPFQKKELRSVCLRSTLVAAVILGVLSGVGSWILSVVFHVEIYSLKVAGGVVLFIIGLTAMRKGTFFEQDLDGQKTDISIVPLAAPLIAGPGAMTAAIAFSAVNGFWRTSVSLLIALACNHVIMLASLWIGKVLEKLNATGPLIRISGLIVAAVAVQMIFQGTSEWLGKVLHP